MSVWTPPVGTGVKEAQALVDTLHDLPSNLVWDAVWHYWHRHEEAERVLVVDCNNWIIPRHVYFAPVHYARDEAQLIERHQQDGAKVICLTWGEFLQRFPRPNIYRIGA